MIKVLIVDDNADVRKGLNMIIASKPDMTVTSIAENGASALSILEKDRTIDIALIDFNMPGMDGIELTRRITASDHPVRIIILTMHRQIIFRDKALEAGARGYLLKGEELEELFKGIRAVYEGNLFVSSGFDI